MSDSCRGRFWGSNIRSILILGLCNVLLFIQLRSFESIAFAEPTRQEVYRNEQLRMFVYRDNTENNVYWYIPPMKLLERDGQIVYYRRPKTDRIDYYFYVVPYMTDDILNLVASEIPNVRSSQQLRPVIAKKFGMRVTQFDAVALGSDVTDYQYLNTPQLVRLSLDLTKTDDFEFFLSNVPGIRADMLIFYTAERVDKYITLELSCHDVYEALRIGATGRYEFIRGEIEDRVFDYLSTRNLNVRARGDIPLPDIVNRAIAECFVPISAPRVSASTFVEELIPATPRPSEISRTQLTQELQRLQEEFARILVPATATSIRQDSISVQLSDLPSPISGGTIGINPPPGTQPPGGATRPPGVGLPGTPGIGINPGIPGSPGIGINPGIPGSPGVPSNPGTAIPPGQDGISFSFRRDAANVNRNFYYHREQVADSNEVLSLPLMLSTSPAAAPARIVATPYPDRQFVVTFDKTQTQPFGTGIFVREGDQFLMSAAFALLAESAYGDGRPRQIRWDSSWPSTQGDLYYRVGTGPWSAVNGRTVISTDTLQRGEIQFYLDRGHIWEHIPENYKRPEFLGILPAILTYSRTFPQFNVVLTGRNVSVRP